MQTAFIVLINIAIAAFIGGLTNFFAIRMLFHPRRPLYVRGRKLPFTPGLIPKRKEEIASSLGNVVGNYLITSEGLRRTLADPVFAGKVRERLEHGLDRLAEREGTLGEWAIGMWGEERVAQWRKEWSGKLEDWMRKGLRHGWHAWRWKDRTVKEILSGMDEATKNEWMERVADAILSALRNELASDRGDRLARQLVARFLQEAGGFLGTIAGMFVNEEQLSRKIRMLAISMLESEGARREIRELLRRKAEEWERLTLGHLLEAAAGEGGFQRLEELASRWLRQMELERHVLDLRWKELLNGRNVDWLKGRMPGLVQAGLEQAEAAVDRIVAAFDLPELVRKQVSAFPVERVEQIVLSVSGREFRAITWLGALLGGMIGLVQSLLLMGMGKLG